jgi:hypothetical protein
VRYYIRSASQKTIDKLKKQKRQFPFANISNPTQPANIWFTKFCNRTLTFSDHTQRNRISLEEKEKPLVSHYKTYTNVGRLLGGKSVNNVGDLGIIFSTYQKKYTRLKRFQIVELCCRYSSLIFLIFSNCNLRK